MTKMKVNLNRIFLVSTILAVIIAFFLTCISFLLIYLEVRTICLKASKEYGNACANSLIQVIRSDKKTYKEKNAAVWALGQLADKRTLPFLQGLLTKTPNVAISQYEVKKAIKWGIEGNITSWMYNGL